MTTETRSLDEQVARTLFGWEPGVLCDGETGELPDSAEGWYCMKCGHSEGWSDDIEHEEAIRPYSSNLNRAWEVVEAMRERGFRLELVGPSPIGEWKAAFLEDATIHSMGRWRGGASAPESICVAALRALAEVQDWAEFAARHGIEAEGGARE